ncbi:N-acetylmuramoyl-L-alanine amidase family protein [Polycladomyces subterraneus]|uniref:N-acetylmuramoyl-L-alanine amidase n=1 Tax=Polycladomyces subterraneus TaxID=1016997 RepID=A0ABT8IMN6_9BACL|nr:N-acetylmuramoyl-L-alanine amidase [Polycladomyces subterraneus]MDN4594012.1 N-acetylmuramoyl-L-alanine amidase [Polycladomyces subterraneus]
MKLIAVDPGHGGVDSGAVGNGLYEKNLTLKIGQLLNVKLKPYQCAVTMTRADDVYKSLDERTNWANSQGADYFISLHHNTFSDPDARGFESYIWNGPVSQFTYDAQAIIHAEVVKYLKGYSVPDRGKKRADFHVLRETHMPAVLLENLFVSNTKDAALLKSDSFLDGLADAITYGLVRCLGLQPDTASVSQAETDPDAPVPDTSDDANE